MILWRCHLKNVSLYKALTETHKRATAEICGKTTLVCPRVRVREGKKSIELHTFGVDSTTLCRIYETKLLHTGQNKICEATVKSVIVISLLQPCGIQILNSGFRLDNKCHPK